MLGRMRRHVSLTLTAASLALSLLAPTAGAVQAGDRCSASQLGARAYMTHWAAGNRLVPISCKPWVGENSFGTVPSTFSGWAFMSTGGAAGSSYGSYAYRWSGSYWSTIVLGPRSELVWVHPYGGDWRWIWTQASGWLAVREERHGSLQPGNIDAVIEAASRPRATVQFASFASVTEYYWSWAG